VKGFIHKSIFMLLNYLKIAFRHFAGHKMFSLINILCLSVGITFCLIIGTYIHIEKRVNSGLKDLDRQYVLKSIWKNANTAPESTTVGPLAKRLKEQYPGLVENYYRYVDLNTVVSAGNNFARQNVALADTGLVSMYGFSLLSGNQSRAFRDNHSAVISESLANRLFGNTDVIDKIIDVEAHNSSKQRFTISAVLKDQPRNTIMDLNGGGQYNLFVPISCDSLFGQSDAANDWSNVFVTSFVKLKPHVQIRQVSKALRQVILANTSDEIKHNLTVTPEGLKMYHLTENNGTIKKIIFALTLIAAFILLMAVINFVNINIGLSSYRLKEIGLRKIFGTNRMQLIFQHLIESVLLTVIAALVSIFLYEVFRQAFNSVLDATLIPFYKLGAREIILFLAFIFMVGISAGAYPAFILSATKLTNAVKGKTEESGSKINLGKLLLILQFTVAIVVFAGALIVSNQVKYYFKKDLGYNKERVLIISSIPAKWDSLGVLQMERARDQFMQIPGIKSASLSSNIPDGKPIGSASLIPKFTNGKKIICPIVAADRNFAAVYGIHIKEGAFFSDNYIPGQVVLNESAERALGLESATGQNFSEVAGVPLKVTGVVHDFNISSLHDKIQPIAIMHIRDLGFYNYLSVKLATSNIHQAITAIQNKCRELYPGIPFEYFFMNDKFQSLYKSDMQLQRASVIATVLNLVIVFLGVVGIISLAIFKRRKEIAVRKVLGADTRRILLLFIKEYGAAMLIANIIAWPLARFITASWLQTYAYRAEPSVSPFIIAGLVTFAAIVAIIIIQCYKVAVSNPVGSLRAD